MSTYEEINLNKPYISYWNRHSITQQQAQREADWKVHWAEFNQAVDRGEEVFFKITNPSHKHFGSIAKVSERHLKNLYGQATTDWTQNDGIWMTLVWNKRKNSIQEYTGSTDIRWLKGYTGDTVYDYDRSRGVQQRTVETPKDRLGREIKVGDFVTYILYHFDVSGAGIYFGNVTKISEKTGAVYCTNIKLNSDDQKAEKRVTYTENLVILTKDLLDQLMLAKLSSL